jgi:hypothetical protein
MACLAAWRLRTSRITESRPRSPRLEDGGRKLVHRQYALGPGGEERLVMELIMIKEPTADPTRK